MELTWSHKDAVTGKRAESYLAVDENNNQRGYLVKMGKWSIVLPRALAGRTSDNFESLQFLIENLYNPIKEK